MQPALDVSKLSKECICFTRHMLRAVPSAYVVEQYLEFHRRSAGEVSTVSRVDAYLLFLATLNPAGTFLADTYASRFLKTCILRKKLVLLLGISECAPGHADYIDSADGRSAALWLRLVLNACAVAISLPFAVLLISPVHIASRLYGGNEQKTGLAHTKTTARGDEE